MIVVSSCLHVYKYISTLFSSIISKLVQPEWSSSNHPNVFDRLTWINKYALSTAILSIYIVLLSLHAPYIRPKSPHSGILFTRTRYTWWRDLDKRDLNRYNITTTPLLRNIWWKTEQNRLKSRYTYLKNRRSRSNLLPCRTLIKYLVQDANVLNSVWTTHVFGVHKTAQHRLQYITVTLFIKPSFILGLFVVPFIHFF